MNVSIIIPVRDERDNIGTVLDEVAGVVATLSGVDRFEIIVVDDGSTDGTAQALSRGVENLRFVSLGRRAGKTAALKAGFDAAEHPVLATMDGDGQDVPAGLGPLLRKIAEGDAFAIGNRRSRQDSPRKKLAAAFANRVRRAVLGDPFEDIGSGLRVFTRACLDDFEWWEGAHRFFPYFAWRAGRRVSAVPVDHRPRRSGASKYGVMDRFLSGSVALARVARARR